MRREEGRASSHRPEIPLTPWLPPACLTDPISPHPWEQVPVPGGGTVRAAPVPAVPAHAQHRESQVHGAHEAQGAWRQMIWGRFACVQVSVSCNLGPNHLGASPLVPLSRLMPVFIDLQGSQIFLIPPVLCIETGFAPLAPPPSTLQPTQDYETREYPSYLVAEKVQPPGAGRDAGGGGDSAWPVRGGLS